MTTTQPNRDFSEFLCHADSPAVVEAVLHMLHIPAGRFLMGSPASEAGRYDGEGPQHEVQLQSFFLAQRPITQAQWRVVASWPKVERDLNPNPCVFEGGDCPVENVNWFEAMEFCRRLSQRTQRTYTLPSEAQWEYACRAGTTTPFHFGETISTELANYGEDREQTTPVWMFPANAWGLQDMHGNVWEWCADHWHDNYEGAPEDGGPWLDENAPEGQQRLLRGGSWDALPRSCRSAYRFRNHPDDRDWGFRVCCLPAEASDLEQEIKRVQQLQKGHEERLIRYGFAPGTVGREVISGLQALRAKQDGKPLRWNIHGKNHQIPESKLQGLSPREISALIYTKVSGWKPTRADVFGRWFVVPIVGAGS